MRDNWPWSEPERDWTGAFAMATKIMALLAAAMMLVAATGAAVLFWELALVMR
jgi:hypothetical protein